MSISTNTIKSPVITERIYTCSDGVKLAARHWVNFDVDDTLSSSQQQCTTRKILCLHGWLDNAASFNRLVPPLLDSEEDIPTQIVALDFPGHGLSGHKSSDGPPQLLAEYAYYVAELVEALQWGKGTGGNNNINIRGSRTVVGNINQNTNIKEETQPDSTITSSDSNIQDNITKNNNNKIILCGHSMGSGVAIVLSAAFPEWFSSIILLEGGLVARNAQDASRHVRAACQRRLKSNKTLFPNGSNNVNGETILPRAKPYSNIDAAIEARLSTTSRMPGDQYLSYEAARDMVLRATSPAKPDEEDDVSVVFRHDPRLQWPSLQYYTREQVEAFFNDIHTSGIPVCFLYAADGWPVDKWGEEMLTNVLKPGYLKKLSGSHHLHADPDSVNAVAKEIVKFLKEQKL